MPRKKKKITKRLIKEAMISSDEPEVLVDVKEEEIEDPFDIDRDQENQDIFKFQKTGDEDLLVKVYHQRVPTLWKWTSMHYIPGLTSTSQQDLFAEFTVVFVTAAHKYDIKRGSFNTCLYTFLDHRIKNIKSRQFAKKRRPKDYKGPITGMMRSLDYTYSNKEGSEVSLKDMLPDRRVDRDVSTNIFFEETLNLLSHENESVKKFMRKLGDGYSFSSLLSEFKTHSGSLKLTPTQTKQLSTKRKCVRIVRDIIKERGKLKSEFKLRDYTIKKNRLHYRVELNKTEETDLIMKSIRKLKRNREDYLDQIEGFRKP